MTQRRAAPRVGLRPPARRAITANEKRRERAFKVGTIVVGAAAGLAAGYLARRAERVVRGSGLVDWARVEELAVDRLERAPGRLEPAELAASEAAYASAMARVVPLLEQRLQRPLPGVVERHAVVDRATWARTNITTFQGLIGKLEDHFLEQLRSGQPSFASSIAALMNRFLTTQQVGFLLGYLGSRVLGQYDIALLSAEAAPGRLLFVEENIRQTARTLDVPLEDFRIWIALHEATHAFEFEAHPWIRPYLAERLERQLASFLDEAKAFQADGLVELAKRFKRPEGDSLLTGFLSAEQRAMLRETQLVMSLLEGFSDWVMDEVGSQVLPDVELLRTRFEARRAQRRRGVDRLVSWITGLDMKLEQYKRGERFVSGVAAAGGAEAVGHLFDGPHALPTEAEMANPKAWVERIAPESLKGWRERIGDGAPPAQA
jgi:coenzyme F420 biosynthesis associated uncharacterized protein